MIVPIKKIHSATTITQDIESNVAWKGKISGLEADKMLRGKKTPYLYILRAGELDTENEKDYYVSFILPNMSIKHQPFVIRTKDDAWHFENTGGCGPLYLPHGINDVLHLIMHAPKDAPQAMIV